MDEHREGKKMIPISLRIVLIGALIIYFAIVQVFLCEFFRVTNEIRTVLKSI